MMTLLREGQKRGFLDVDSLQMIEGVLAMSRLRVRDIMVPRAQMVTIQEDQSFESMLDPIISSGHSRFPVTGEDRDEVVGILLAKDLLRYFAAPQPAAFDLHDFVRPAVFVPESKRINVLLKEFRSSHNHMAIVVNEYGGVAGLVTIEDVLEEIVGDIGDEHDRPAEQDIQQVAPDRYQVKALTEIESFNAYFGTTFSDAEYDTVGGLVMHHMGHLPHPGESVALHGVQFQVLRSDRRRIHTLEVVPNGGDGVETRDFIEGDPA
jgi:magnesium and cobalt transporter